MNPAHFPNPGGGMSGVPKPGMQPPKNENAQVIMSHVAQALQSQGQYGGWKGEVQIKTRAVNVYQMITSLRLIQPRIDLHTAAQAALSFEQKAFQKATERADYEKECNEKLLHIKDTRQRQAAVAMQSGMMPQAGAMQNQLQGGFPQMNRAMQSSSVPGQPQMGMGMADPNQQAVMQRQQQQSAMLQQQQQQQRAQQRPGNASNLPDDVNTLSPQEREHVSRLANQMLAKTSPEDMEKIKMNLSNMNTEQRDYLARNDMDPMTYFFRSQALNQLRRHRRARMEMGRASNAGIDPNGAMMGDPMMNQRQLYQSMMNLQRNSAFSGNPGQGLENAFIGSIENIQGQQADGLRSQEAGQLVVPASSSQMNQPPFPNQQNVFPQQMSQNGQPNMNGGGVNAQLFGQQHIPGGSNGPQDRMQFAQHNQAQAQAQARAQAAQKAQMAMSGHGGQANAQAQAHLAQSSPVMPMLNQPMAPAQMSPAQMPAQARPASRPPNMGQHPAGVQGVSQPPMQGRPQIPPGLPQAVQEQLNRMSNEQLHTFLLNQRRAALANNMARANAAQQTGGLQQSASQPGQGPQQIFNSQMGNNARMRNSMSMPQGMNPGAPSQPQQLQGQQLTPQQRAQQQQRQNELYKLHILRQHNNGMEMTAEQGKEMDRASFPPSLLGNNPQVPKHIKTWGQIKQWVATNPQAANGLDLQKLMTFQKMHFAQILAAQAKDSNNQGQGVLAQPFQGPQAQMANGHNFPPGQPQLPSGMPAMRPITPQDVQVARQKLGPQAHNFSDEQMREIIRNRQRQILMQAAQNRAQMSANMPPGQNQAIQQPAVSVPQSTAQVKSPAIPQPPQATGDQQVSNTKVLSGGPAKGAKATTGKGPTKKKSNVDEPGDNRATNTPQQPQPVPLPTAAPPKPGIPLTQEQFAAMNPQQRLQIETQMRKQQQSLLRGPVLSKAAAEDAWNNNIPSRIMEVYHEIAKNAPPTKPVPVSPEQKAIMTQQLRDSLDVLGRLDVVVMHGFGKMQGQEKNVKNLLAMRIQLMRQFKPGPDWIVNEHFTISPDYLTSAILFIRKLFQLMIVRMNQQRPNANQASSSAAQTTSANTAALNATNLQQLQQQQEEALQRARRASSQSAVAPAPFGAPSPQGVPHAYGPGGLAPDKLKLPPPKKRKQSQAGPSGSPVQSSAPPMAAARSKQAVVDAKSTAAAFAGMFKCNVVECQHHYQGFPTQAALDKHVEESHRPEEEVVDDPLQYYLDSIDIGLGLAADGQQNQQVAATTSTPAMANNKLNVVASPTKPGIATPVTASTTPMARATSQLGTKTASPATSTQQLTPHLVSGKVAKPSPNQDAKKQPGKRTFDEMEAKDQWADCPMSLEQLHDTLAPTFADCQRKGLGYDPFDEFMNTDMFSQDQTEDTPDSWDIGLATLTPKDENKGEIKGGVLWADWMPWDEESIAANLEWMQIPPELLDTSEPFEGAKVDWERFKQQQKETNFENGGIAIAAL
ncbi:uncharacterized protein N7459_002821 [Penicillium hispanicum]|uniref:uncharacterized protein n=1 Tax=Penicillium hispanicum TaxID=1080232 RepID=UPI002540F324|nr:uncharacterized protein N7459_002821 [Penicillium hispanicum]KAJ5587056.1 hypothetical protein N7459_002821 [Penicillium hispanicum]